MSNIDTELEQAGAEFRRSGEDLPHRSWDAAAPKPLIARQTLAVAFAVVLLVGIPMLVFGGQGTTDVADVGAPPASSETATPTQAPASDDPTAMALENPPTQPPASDATSMVLENPPHLVLEAEGWDMIRHYEDSYPPRSTTWPLIFRPQGEEIGSMTLIVMVFEITETTGWSAGERAEVIELEGRILSIIPDSSVSSGHHAGVEFDDGTLIVVKGFDMDRTDFIDAAKQIELSPNGEPVLEPPAGFERVSLPSPYAETVTRRESVYQGPGGASAEVRIWSGTLTDVEMQVINRAIDGRAVRFTTVDGAPVVISYRSDGLERVFVVGGDDGYVIEIDFTLAPANATDAALDAILAQIRKVDLATFEAALPEGSITSATANEVVADMLADIPLPEEFDTSVLVGIGDRYTAVVQVAGAVACAWIDQWIDATVAGDIEQIETAVNALATSHDWPILLEIQDQGGWADVLWQYADAVGGDGTVVGGRILTVEESYENALGCGGG